MYHCAPLKRRASSRGMRRAITLYLDSNYLPFTVSTKFLYPMPLLVALCRPITNLFLVPISMIALPEPNIGSYQLVSFVLCVLVRPALSNADRTSEYPPYSNAVSKLRPSLMVSCRGNYGRHRSLRRVFVARISSLCMCSIMSLQLPAAPAPPPSETRVACSGWSRWRSCPSTPRSCLAFPTPCTQLARNVSYGERGG